MLVVPTIRVQATTKHHEQGHTKEELKTSGAQSNRSIELKELIPLTSSIRPISQESVVTAFSRLAPL
jgi:hypothetical protein